MVSRRRSHRLAMVAMALGMGMGGAGTDARANLRAPVMVLASPSGGLHGTAAGLFVRGEKLGFDCDPMQCRVRATYAVRAAAAGRFAFAFVLPVARPIAVKVGGAMPDVAVEETVEVPPSHSMVRDESGRTPKTWEAKFEATLETGDGTITVEYDQPLASTEHDYGYFKSHGRMVSDFEYILGPIKDWAMDPGFQIELTVAMPRKAPGWWKRHFGTVRGIACANSNWHVVDGKGEQKGDRYVHTVLLAGRDFPDRINCYLGDEDLLPKKSKDQK